jgi:hypothetical protein
MLDALLDDYLRTAVSPDVMSLVEDAHALFDLYELDGYEDEFIEIVMNADQVDSHVSAERILDQTREYQLDVLRQHGITVVDGVRMRALNILLRALYDVQASLQGESIIDRCTQDIGPEEIAAEVFGLVSGQNSEAMLLWLAEVSPALIAQIVSWVDRNETDLDVELIRQKELRVEAFQWYVDKYQIDQLKLAYLIEHGLDVYHPAKLYLNILGPDFNQLELAPLLHEFFAIALISSDYALRPAELINEYAEQYIADVNMVTRLTIQAHEVALTYGQEGPAFDAPPQLQPVSDAIQLALAQAKTGPAHSITR